ncbi:Sterol desaturase family protein [Apiospora kogelbergensis]|uniref:Sterol desaturase family protein n=1 Tax=Apiospora kogelbergensis TaxID=1337665 RepID=A0AAW0R264_9PEZI
MDVILSLPIVSYFAAPMLTSWSTSMNLLFFYMTWTTLVLSHSPLKIELVGTLAVRVVFWLLPSLLFLLFDAGVPSLAETIKFHGSASLPRRNAAALARQVGLAVANLLVVTAVQAGLSMGATMLLKEPLFQTATTLPLPWYIIKHVAMLYAAREVLTYYIHRDLLHSRRLGGAAATLHNRWAHGTSSRWSGGGAPYALMAYADHPLPLVLHRVAPVYLPALAVRPHLLTYFVFTLLTTIEETLAMSGYSAVPGIVMGGVARRTATHYASGGRGNFSALGFLDWIHGTSVGKDVIDDIQDEADKHRVKERGRRKANEGKGMVQDGIDSWRKNRKGGKKN